MSHGTLRQLGRTASMLLTLSTMCGPSGAQAGVRSWGWGLTYDSSWNDEPFVAVGAGLIQTAALRADGSVVQWGLGVSGALPLPPGVNYVEIAVAGYEWLSPFYGYPSSFASSTVARRSDGALAAWGDNSMGQCNTPTPPSGVTCVEIAAGAMHCAARWSDGSIVAWGDAWFGKCDVPALPPGLSYVEVAAADEPWGGWFSGPARGHTVARRSDGSVVAWGDDSYGQCDTPALPSGVVYVEISAGAHHTVARRSDGSVVAWGDNGSGQCNTPAPPVGLAYVELSAGAFHTLARLSDGSVVAWGENGSGQCAVPSLPPGVVFTGLAAGAYHSVAHRSDGSTVSWGDNSFLQRNLPALADGVDYVGAASSALHAVALCSDGSIRTMGRGGANGAASPAPALPPGLRYLQVAAGNLTACEFECSEYSFSLALRSDGAIVTWDAIPPAPSLPAGLAYVDLVAGNEHVLALRSDGWLVAWGDDTAGQTDVPTLPPGVRYLGAAAGARHSLGVRSDGEVVAWGSNGSGETDVPALPPGLAYVEVAAGGNHSLARRSDGSVVAWGSNLSGECDVPAAPSGRRYVEIAATAGSSFARLDDGTVAAWGQTGTPAPALPAELTYVAISAGAGGASLSFEPVVARFCSAGATTHGCTPSISASGVARASESSGFTIRVDGVEGDRSGVLFYAFDDRSAAPTPWSAGSSSRMCLRLPAQRMGQHGTGGSSGHCDGALSTDWNAFVRSHPGALGAPFAGGETICAQAWFRDPPAPASSNLSDALRFHVAP